MGYQKRILERGLAGVIVFFAVSSLVVQAEEFMLPEDGMIEEMGSEPMIPEMVVPQVSTQASGDIKTQVWTLPTDTKSDRIDALELKDMDINDVFKLLAARSGLNIVAGKSVQGRVTIFLKNVPVRDALMLVLRANALAYHEQDGILEIMPAAEYEQKYGGKFGVVTTSAIFPVHFARAEDMVKILNPMLTPGVGVVDSDIRSNKVIVTDTPAKIEEIRKMVEALDRKDLETKTEVFNINYAKAEDIVKAITPILTKEVGHVESDLVSNKVIVTDVALKIEAVRYVIKSLDHKQKEAFIEARIVQVKLTDGFRMGIDWEAILSKDGKGKATTKNDFTLGANVVPRSITTIGTLSQDSYQVVLDMIATVGDTKLLSSPRIAAINNQEAKILIGSTKPYVTTTIAQSTSGQTNAETVNFIDVGVKLNVTPTIHDDGYITMKIRPEISTAATSLTTAQKNEIPIVETSQVETTIRVKDGVTIIIGGLIKDEATNDKSKIPFLGDIPMLGKAFRSEEKTSEKSEIVIFLTPHIITGDVQEDPRTYMTIKRSKDY